MGKGHLKLGLLADQWLLNSIAILIARPEVLFYCFASTGQEERGRYCTRFHECGGWRSIYFDDRIPCGFDGNPLFASSSCDMESCVMIIEKGLAKYLGSYGKLGLCGMRTDAPLTSLRMMSGGHVYKLATRDYDWKSVDDDVQGENGFEVCREFLKEGSLIAFGRSDLMAYMRQPKNESIYRNLPPNGKFFPLVGTIIADGK